MVCIDVLKGRLSVQNTLYAQNEKGYYVETGFAWNKPIAIEELNSFENEYGYSLPNTYKEFLRISNGAILFKDLKYGQWGCRILSLDEAKIKTVELKGVYGYKNCHFVFTQWIGDSDVLIFDLERVKQNNKYNILYGDMTEKISSWEYLKGDFNQWLDRLIVSQGSKYWHWF
jgi:hypothetical protein